MNKSEYDEEEQRETQNVSQLLFHERDYIKRRRNDKDPSDEESEEHEWNENDEETISAEPIIDLEEEEVVPKKLKIDLDASRHSYSSDSLGRSSSNLRRIILDSDED